MVLPIGPKKKPQVHLLLSPQRVRYLHPSVPPDDWIPYFYVVRSAASRHTHPRTRGVRADGVLERFRGAVRRGGEGRRQEPRPGKAQDRPGKPLRLLV